MHIVEKTFCINMKSSSKTNYYKIHKLSLSTSQWVVHANKMRKRKREKEVNTAPHSRKAFYV